MKYGDELILDLHGCDPALFTAARIEEFMRGFCDKILDMTRGPFHVWGFDDPLEKAQAASHLKGTSAIQFIETSNVTIHCLDDLGSVYLNVFSCKPFDVRSAIRFCSAFFHADTWVSEIVTRSSVGSVSSVVKSPLRSSLLPCGADCGGGD